MSVRFRIRTSAGQELSFASRETFEDFVRSGDFSPDDLVYDGEDGSWAPARTHPIVLDIEYEKEAAAEAASEAAASGTPREDASADSDDAPADALGASATGAAAAHPDLGLDLAPADELTPDDEAAAFVRKMEAEREADLDLATPGGGVGGFKMEDSGSLAGMLRPVPEAPPPPAPSEPVSAPAPPPRRAAPSWVDDDEPEPAPAPPVPSPAPGRRRFLTAALVVLLLGGGGYLAYTVFGAPATVVGDGGTGPVATPAPEEPVPTPTPPPPREPVIAGTEAAVRERARERYLAATQSELRALRPVPPAWATGPYFATPSEHPEVVEIWRSYVDAIRRVRSQDTERYGTAYRAALDDAAIVGDARTTRLEAAMADFGSGAAARRAHFDRVEGLATAALQSHDALLEAEGLILYDQAGGRGRGSLGAGASGRDADAQLLLDQVRGLLADRLAGDGMGPREASRVREWVWDGLLEAVTGPSTR